MKTLFYYCFLAFATIALSACSAEDGETGPAGPQGEQGIPGEDGNANIIYSDWFALDTYIDKFNETLHDGNTEGIVYVFENPDITQEILDSGNLYIYFKTSSGAVFPFPIEDFAAIGMTLYYMTLNEFAIIIYNEGSTNPGDALIVEDVEAFRYVIIPGGTPAQAIDMEKIIEQTPIQQ